MATAAPALAPKRDECELVGAAKPAPARVAGRREPVPSIISQQAHVSSSVLWRARSSVLRNLSPTELVEILSAAQQRCFERRDVLFQEGDRAAHVAVILSGHVKVTRLTAGGSEVILVLSGAGELIGDIEAIESVQQTTAAALKSCHALFWDANTFAALMRRYPVLQQNVLMILADRLVRAEERLSELATEKVAPRLARMLARLLPHGERVEGGLLICLTREELAQLTGTTLFTVSRLLSQWENGGTVSARREAVLVRDPGGLEQLATVA